MSEIKARQVLAFLAQFPADAWTEREAPPVPSEPDSRPTEKKSSADSDSAAGEHPAPLPESLTVLIAAAARTQGEVITLLLSVHAPEFRSRLMKELARIATRAEALILDAPFLSPKDQEKAARRLRRIAREMNETSALTTIDRKTQANLADSLAEHFDKLAEVRVESGPAITATHSPAESSNKKKA